MLRCHFLADELSSRVHGACQKRFLVLDGNGRLVQDGHSRRHPISCAASALLFSSPLSLTDMRPARTTSTRTFACVRIPPRTALATFAGPMTLPSGSCWASRALFSDRLRQYGKPDAGARHGPADRDGCAAGNRRFAVRIGAATFYRSAAHCSAWGRSRDGSGSSSAKVSSCSLAVVRTLHIST